MGTSFRYRIHNNHAILHVPTLSHGQPLCYAMDLCLHLILFNIP